MSERHWAMGGYIGLALAVLVILPQSYSFIATPQTASVFGPPRGAFHSSSTIKKSKKAGLPPLMAEPLDAASDLAQDMSAQLAALTDGYHGLVGENSPVLLGVLNQEQMGLLGEIADKSVIQHVISAIGHMVEKFQLSLHSNPFTESAWGGTEDLMSNVHNFMAPTLQGLEKSLELLGLSENQAKGAMTAAALIGTAAIFSNITEKMAIEDRDEIPTEYDLEQIEAYYQKHQLLVAVRFLEVSGALTTYALQLLSDLATDSWEKNMPARAAGLRDLCTQIGPAFIKVGQGASIRPDILPQPYITAMQQLQDKVPPFHANDAKNIIESQLGSRLQDLFVDTSVFDEPIAAASLGQVYRATLKSTGEEVAVKVQRPEVLFTVTRDLHVMRMILNLLSNVGVIGDACTAFRDLIDSWAVRFMEEMNYLTEADNAERFSREMGKSETLGEAILVPKPYRDLTTRYILTTEWVEGTRVSDLEIESPEGRARVATIQATLLNSYLTQLLESGFLHADPHPGNFLITQDGRICILDYGLMTEVNEDQRYALVEYVIHLIGEDYDATLQDLIILDFIDPQIGEDPAKAALVVPLLATVLEQLSKGGGAKGITIESVGEEVEQLAKDYPIGIPPYFGLIIRAFGSIEGLGLSMDPEYSIVNECFPYLCRRLLSEDTPRMREMLKAFLYGQDGDVLQLDQVDEIIEGYRKYTSLASQACHGDALTQQQSEPRRRPKLGPFPLPPLSSTAQAAVDPLSDPVARDALKLLFAKEGNYVQDLMVEEMARMVDALGRSFNLEAMNVMHRVADGVVAPLPMVSFKPKPEQPLNPLLLPLQLPYIVLDRMLGRMASALELSYEDQESLRALRRLLQILTSLSGDSTQQLDPAYADTEGLADGINVAGLLPSLSPTKVLRSARNLVPILPLVGPGAGAVGKKFVRRLAGLTLARMADNITPQGSQAHVEGYVPDSALGGNGS